MSDRSELSWELAQERYNVLIDGVYYFFVKNSAGLEKTIEEAKLQCRQFIDSERFVSSVYVKTEQNEIHLFTALGNRDIGWWTL